MKTEQMNYFTTIIEKFEEEGKITKEAGQKLVGLIEKLGNSRLGKSDLLEGAIQTESLVRNTDWGLNSYPYGKVWECDLKMFDLLNEIDIEITKDTDPDTLSDSDITTLLAFVEALFGESALEGDIWKSDFQAIVLLIGMIIYELILISTAVDEEPLYFGIFSGEVYSLNQNMGLMPVSYQFNSYLRGLTREITDFKFCIQTLEGKWISISGSLARRVISDTIELESLRIKIIDLLK